MNRRRVDRKGTPEADPRKELQTNDRRVNFAKRIPRDVILKTDNGRRAEGTERKGERRPDRRKAEGERLGK